MPSKKRLSQYENELKAIRYSKEFLDHQNCQYEQSKHWLRRGGNDPGLREFHRKRVESLQPFAKVHRRMQDIRRALNGKRIDEAAALIIAIVLESCKQHCFCYHSGKKFEPNMDRIEGIVSDLVLNDLLGYWNNSSKPEITKLMNPALLRLKDVGMIQEFEFVDNKPLSLKIKLENFWYLHFWVEFYSAFEKNRKYTKAEYCEMFSGKWFGQFVLFFVVPPACQSHCKDVVTHINGEILHEGWRRIRGHNWSWTKHNFEPSVQLEEGENYKSFVDTKQKWFDCVMVFVFQELLRGYAPGQRYLSNAVKIVEEWVQRVMQTNFKVMDALDITWTAGKYKRFFLGDNWFFDRQAGGVLLGKLNWKRKLGVSLEFTMYVKKKPRVLSQEEEFDRLSELLIEGRRAYKYSKRVPWNSSERIKWEEVERSKTQALLAAIEAYQERFGSKIVGNVCPRTKEPYLTEERGFFF